MLFYVTLLLDAVVLLWGYQVGQWLRRGRPAAGEGHGMTEHQRDNLAGLVLVLLLAALLGAAYVLLRVGVYEDKRGSARGVVGCVAHQRRGGRMPEPSQRCS